MSTHADMESILSDMMGGDDCPYGEIIKKDQENSYYNGFGIHLSRQIENNDHYFNLLMGVVDKFKHLDEEKKQMIQNKMEIFPKTIVKEKIVYKDNSSKSKKTNSKPKLNMMDDY